MKKSSFLFAVCCSLLIADSVFSVAEAAKPWLLPDLKNNQLRDSLRILYKPPAVMSYEAAKDEVFKIHRVKTSTTTTKITCIYTGAQYVVNTTLDPSTQAWDNGFSIEHAWPQSQGADDGNPKSDMHHLFPVRQAANLLRSNKPFGDIADTLATQWIKDFVTQSTMPAEADRKNWSRVDEVRNLFQPRDQFKGDVARATMWFWVMYADSCADSIKINPPANIWTMVQWAEADSISPYENIVTWAVSQREGGKVNPFCLDNTIARRCFEGWAPALMATPPPPNFERLRVDTVIVAGPDSLWIPNKIGVNVVANNYADWLFQFDDWNGTDTTKLYFEQSYDGVTYLPMTPGPMEFTGSFYVPVSNIVPFKSYHMRLLIRRNADGGSLKILCFVK